MKQGYRGVISFILLCSLSLIFVSCAASAPASSVSPGPSSSERAASASVPDRDAAAAAEGAAGEEIPAEEIFFHTAAEGTVHDAGFYEITLREDGSGNIYNTDFDALRRTVLCSRPGCSHCEEGCSGYLPCAANIPEVMAASDLLIFAYSGNPYYFTDLGDQTLARVEIRDLNGENARTICTFDANVQLDFNFAFSESALFALGTTFQSESTVAQREVIKIDLATGEKTVLARFDGGSEERYYFVGAAKGKLFFKKSWIDEAVLNGAEITSTEDITNALSFALFTVDPRTGETAEVRRWESGETLQKIVGDACFYVNPGSIDQLDLDTYEMKRVVSGQEYCSPDTVEQVYFMDPYLIYNIHYPAEDPADAVIKRFICNVETLELRESTLTTSFRGISDPVFIAALTPRFLLVGYSIEEVPPAEQPAFHSSIRRRYAMLDFQAFVQNQPDYAVISEDF